MPRLKDRTDNFIKTLYDGGSGPCWQEVVPVVPLEAGCPIVGGSIVLKAQGEEIIYTQRGVDKGMRYAFASDLKFAKIDLDQPVGYAYAKQLLAAAPPPTEMEKLELALQLHTLIEGGHWK
jgi:hypothetical protein